MAMGLCSLGRGRSGRRYIIGAIHVAGSTIGGAMTGLALGAAGRGVGAERFATWVVAPAAAAAILWSLRDRGPLGFRRQVPRQWGRSMPPTPRFLLWGGLLGCGVVTLVPYSAFVALCALEFTAGPASALVAGALYGLGRAGPPTALGLIKPPSSSPEEFMQLIPTLRAPARLLNGFLAIGALALAAASWR